MDCATLKSIYVFCTVALAGFPRVSSGAPFHADTSQSGFVVRTTRAGLLSLIAHNHQFTPGTWDASIDFTPERPEEVHVDITVDAATLHDHEPRLSPTSQRYVDRETAGPDVLDALHYATIRFHSESASVHTGGPLIEGVLHGTLSLHGHVKPLDVPFHARREGDDLRASGAVHFRQTDFGMTPFSTAGGTIGVDDEVQVEFDLVLRRTPADGVATRTSGEERGAARRPGH